MWDKHHIIIINKTYLTSTTKIIQPIFKHHIYLKTQQQLTNQEIQGKEHETYSENKKTHSFFLKIEVEMMKKMVDVWVKHGESMSETNEEDNEQSKMFKGKLKSFENCL